MRRAPFILLLLLPWLPGCFARPAVQPPVVAPRPADALPFSVAVLPVVGPPGQAPGSGLDLAPAAATLAASLDGGVFVAASAAPDPARARASGADLILAAELSLLGGPRERGASVAPAEAALSGAAATSGDSAAEGGAFVVARFYEARLPGGEEPVTRGLAGLAVALELPLRGDEESWEPIAEALATAIRSQPGALEEPALAPFRLVSGGLRFAPSADGTSLSGEVRFAPESRSRHLRRVRAGLADGRWVPARLAASDTGGRTVEFSLELPPLPAGTLLPLEIEAGSRVRYRRHYTLRIP